MNPKTLSEYFRLQGRKGGKAGTGKSKKRGNSAYYRALAAKAAAARAARKKDSGSA